jgi:WD40 repeat protein
VWALAYSPDGQTLVTGGVGEFRVWDAGGALRRTVTHPDTVWALAFAPDGKLLAVGSGEPRAGPNGAAGLWDCERWSEVRWWPSGGGMVRAVAFSPDGKCWATGAASGAVEIRDRVAR